MSKVAIGITIFFVVILLVMVIPILVMLNTTPKAPQPLPASSFPTPPPPPPAYQPAPQPQPQPAPQPAPAPSVNWKMVPNTAFYLGGLQQSNIIKTIPNGNPDSCKAACGPDPNCKGFFYNARGGITGGGFSFANQDCVLFNAPLWGGAAGMSDSYVKE